MFCNKCGANIADDSKFCNSCGASVQPPVQIVINNGNNANNGNNNNNVADANNVVNNGGNNGEGYHFSQEPCYNEPKKSKKGKKALVAIILAVAIVLTTVVCAFVGSFTQSNISKFLKLLKNTFEDGFDAELQVSGSGDGDSFDETVNLYFAGLNKGDESHLALQYDDYMYYSNDIYEMKNTDYSDHSSGYLYDYSEIGMSESQATALAVRSFAKDVLEILIEKDYELLGVYLNSLCGERMVDTGEFEDRVEDILDDLKDEDYLKDNFNISIAKDGGTTSYVIDIDLHDILDWSYKILEESKDVFVYESDYEEALEEYSDELEDIKEDVNVKIEGELYDSDELKKGKVSVDLINNDKVMFSGEVEFELNMEDEDTAILEAEIVLGRGGDDYTLKVNVDGALVTKSKDEAEFELSASLSVSGISVGSFDLEGTLVTEDSDNAKIEASASVKLGEKVLAKAEISLGLFCDDDFNSKIDVECKVSDGNDNKLFSCKGTLEMTVEKNRITSISGEGEATIDDDYYEGEFKLTLTNFGESKVPQDILDKLEDKKGYLDKSDEIRWNSEGTYYYDDNYDRVFID